MVRAGAPTQATMSSYPAGSSAPVPCRAVAAYVSSALVRKLVVWGGQAAQAAKGGGKVSCTV